MLPFSEHSSNVDDPSLLADHYDSVLSNLLDVHAPMKTRTIVYRPNAPWFDEDLRESKRKKRRHERKWLKSGLEIDHQLYIQQCKDHRKKVEQAKCAYHRDQISSCDDRQLFKIVNRLSKFSASSVLPDHSCSKTLANDFGEFFKSKVRKLLDVLDNIEPPELSVSLVDSCDSQFSSFQEVTVDDVRKILMKSAVKSSPLDPIPTDLLKKCLDLLLPHFTRVINSSLLSGVMPQSLKIAQVTPLVKKANADRNELKNYRPISNLKFLSKTVERVATAQLTQYLVENDLYAKNQSAYRKFHSTETALVRIHNDILLAADKHLEAILILLDFSAAFDTLSHQVLINRLRERYGVEGTALEWYKSYLEDRLQAISIKGELSENILLEEGVPQGSVNGPLLFTLFSAPLGDVIKSHDINFMTYADDTQMYLVLHPSERDFYIPRLELCLRDIKAWTMTNRLVLNDSKTELVHICSKFVKSPSFPKITIGTSEVDISTAAKNLGVVFDKSLDMKDHVKNLVRAASFAIYRIGRLRRYLDRPSVERLVHAFVSSRLDSCNALLYGLQEKEIAKLQRVQNTAARLVTGCKKHDHITPVLRDLHWLPVHQRIRYKIALLAFKALHGMAPRYITELVEERKPPRALRSASELLLRPPKIPKNHVLRWKGIRCGSTDSMEQITLQTPCNINFEYFQKRS